jgi:hypothetical protein
VQPGGLFLAFEGATLLRGRVQLQLHEGAEEPEVRPPRVGLGLANPNPSPTPKPRQGSALYKLYIMSSSNVTLSPGSGCSRILTVFFTVLGYTHTARPAGGGVPWAPGACHAGGAPTAAPRPAEQRTRAAAPRQTGCGNAVRGAALPCLVQSIAGLAGVPCLGLAWLAVACKALV